MAHDNHADHDEKDDRNPAIGLPLTIAVIIFIVAIGFYVTWRGERSSERSSGGVASAAEIQTRSGGGSSVPTRRVETIEIKAEAIDTLQIPAANEDWLVLNHRPNWTLCLDPTDGIDVEYLVNGTWVEAAAGNRRVRGWRFRSETAERTTLEANWDMAQDCSTSIS